MIYFDRTTPDAGEQFQRWRQSNPQTFVLNEGTYWMLHLGKCFHLKPRYGYPLSGKPLGSRKTCSKNFTDLERRAERNNQPLSLCVDCAVREARSEPEPIKAAVKSSWRQTAKAKKKATKKRASKRVSESGKSSKK